MITDIREILQKAKDGGYAVGAFNTINLETTRAIMEAAKELKSPVIIQITERTMDYAGGRMIYNMIKNDVEFYAPEIPVAIHLDHGKSLEAVERCVEIGLGSVMYDGSRKEYIDNVSATKKVVDFCHEKGVAVQGELGSVPYLSENKMVTMEDWDKYMTDPLQAKDFVEKTGVDTLAVAIGNAHGFFIERETPDWERLEKVRAMINVPIVLHGASDWEEDRVEKAIQSGVNCFNVDTNTQMTFVNSLSATFSKSEDPGIDLRKILGKARDAVKESVKHKMELFGSAGKV